MTALDDRDLWTAENCAVARALDVVGTRSALLLLREAFYGTRRFDDFARRVGISEPVAARRLAGLVGAGLLVKVPYREPGSRSRLEYRLSDSGRELLPALVALMQWGDRWVPDEAGPPVELTHRDCGQPVHAQLRCSGEHDVGPSGVEVHPGPGARRRGPSGG